MSRERVLLVVGVLGLAAACGKREEAAAPPGPGQAVIRFNCDNDGGASVSVKPFRVQLPSRKGQIEWTLVGSDVDSVLISPKNPLRWPFTAPPPIIVKSAKSGIGKDVPDSVAAGTYKYNVTGICVREGGVADTVIFDPDMIIPGLLTDPI